jgi:hypothetical protein
MGVEANFACPSEVPYFVTTSAVNLMTVCDEKLRSHVAPFGAFYPVPIPTVHLPWFLCCGGLDTRTFQSISEDDWHTLK